MNQNRQFTDPDLARPSTTAADDWNRMPRWLKRISGFFSYQLFSFFALFQPEDCDRLFYEILRDQFNHRNPK